MSADGTNQTAVASAGSIWRTTDGGLVWHELSMYCGDVCLSYIGNWKSVAMSADSKLQTAVDSGADGIGNFLRIANDHTTAAQDPKQPVGK